jgi:hypothetical protein
MHKRLKSNKSSEISGTEHVPQIYVLKLATELSLVNFVLMNNKSRKAGFFLSNFPSFSLHRASIKCEHADPYNIKSILPSLYWSHALWLQMSKPFAVSTPPLLSWAFVEILWSWRGIYKALKRTYWVQKEFKLSAVAVLCHIKFSTTFSKLIHFLKL